MSVENIIEDSDLVLAGVFLSLGTLSLLVYYRSKNTPLFPTCIIIYLSWLLGFAGILLLPFDLAYSQIKGQPTRWIEDAWTVVYWTTFILTWAVLPMMADFETSGEFSFRRKCVSIIKGQVKMALIAVIVFVCFCFYLLAAKHMSFEGIGGFIMALGNTYGLMLIILLLGNGLVSVPKRIWLASFPQRNLQILYYKAAELDSQLYDALFDLEEVEDEIIHVAEELDKLRSLEGIEARTSASAYNKKKVNKRGGENKLDSKTTFFSKITKSYLSRKENSSLEDFSEGESDEDHMTSLSLTKGSSSSSTNPNNDKISDSPSSRFTVSSCDSNITVNVPLSRSACMDIVLKTKEDFRNEFLASKFDVFSKYRPKGKEYFDGTPPGQFITIEYLSMLHSKLKRMHRNILSKQYQWDSLIVSADLIEDIANCKLPKPELGINNSNRNSSCLTPLIDGCIYLRDIIWWYYTLYLSHHVYKIMAFLCAGLSLLFIWSECVMGIQSIFLLPYGKMLEAYGQSSFMAVLITSLIPFLYLSLCTYRSLFKFRLFGEMNLQGPQQSSSLSLLLNAQYLIRLQFPLGYNYLLLLRYKASDNTGFMELMSNMTVIPILGTDFNVYAPLLMVLLIVFTVFNGYARLLKLVNIYHEDLMGTEEEYDERIAEGKRLVSRNKGKRNESPTHRPSNTSRISQYNRM